MGFDSRLTQINNHCMSIDNPYNIDVKLFANNDVPVEAAAITELLEMLDLQKTVEQFAKKSPGSFHQDPRVEKVAVTPDFHKARGIPVGTVLATEGFIVPQAIGNDINCGMRLHTTTLHANQIKSKLNELETVFRHIYFEGGRNIPMLRQQRQALFKNGLLGLLDATPKSLTEGIWELFHRLDIEKDIERVERYGSLEAQRIFGLDDFLGPSNRLSRDNQIGSIGGGNHFVEIQYVAKIINGTIAHAWGLKPDMVTVMVHTGSVSIGHLCGNYYRDVVKEIYPKNLKYPANGIFILPQGEQHQKQTNLFWDAMHNAANFAFANRMFLALMALTGLNKICGDTNFPLLYDAPHNLVWKESIEDKEVFIHRKGACPAYGLQQMKNTAFEYYGQPVMVPGSMGSSSFILAGQGKQDSLYSASHGAGRALSRGKTLKGYDKEFHDFIHNFRIVTPVDFRRADIKMRQDIYDKKLNEIKQEAPYAYKGIGPIIQTLHGAGIASPVAELQPIMTIKA